MPNQNLEFGNRLKTFKPLSVLNVLSLFPNSRFWFGISLSSVPIGFEPTHLWFQRNNPNQETLYFSITVPKGVTAIVNDGFRDNYTSAKKSMGAVTSNDSLGRYSVAAIDFLQAEDLATIQYQAAMQCSYLSGVLDLSKTHISLY